MQVKRFSRGGAEVEQSRRCNTRGAEVQGCIGAEVKKCRGAEVLSRCRVRHTGAGVGICVGD